MRSVQYIQQAYERPVIECNIVSGLAFTFNGGECLIVPKAVRHTYAHPVTYRVRDLNTVNTDLFECVMEGSDGSVLKFMLTGEDMMHNIAMAEATEPVIS